MMDRTVEDPLYRMHHGWNTFSLEINWAYTNTSEKLEKKKTSNSTPATRIIQDGCRLSSRNRNRRRAQRRKAARALRCTTTAESPIVVTPDVTTPAKTTPSQSTPMDQGTSGSLPPGDVEEPPPPEIDVHWRTGAHGTYKITDFYHIEGRISCTAPS